ncbi:copper chaperone PCu(A)C [Undibacterium luofuense]|uniref:copper chaperone PCu(A)C n=1 Tax=Undibacterium luofuense TaxID=2828733 RepID=UPI0030EDFDF9
MKSMKFGIAFLATACVTLSASAEVVVSQPWVRATVPQQMATGAFMQLKSSQDSRLVAVATSAADRAEIHEMKMENQVMRMREIDGLPLPQGQDVALKPGGMHIMLMGLKKPLTEGESVTLQLTFEDKAKKREVKEVVVPVRSLTKPAH